MLIRCLKSLNRAGVESQNRQNPSKLSELKPAAPVLVDNDILKFKLSNSALTVVVAQHGLASQSLFASGR